MNQRYYKEVFDDIKMSEDKKKEIEMNMTKVIKTKRRVAYKKVVVLAASMVMLLSTGVIAYAATEGKIFEGIANIFGITIDGKEVDIEDYTDEKGEISLDNLTSDGFIVAVTDEDNNGDAILKVETSDDPRNVIAWYFMKDSEKESELYIAVPKRAILKEDMDLINIEGISYMEISEKLADGPVYIEFAYEGKDYNVEVMKGEDVPKVKIYEVK